MGGRRRVIAVRACGAGGLRKLTTVGVAGDAHLFGKCVSSSSSSIVSRSEQPISITAEVRPGGTASVPPLRCATCIVARSASPCMVTVVSDPVRRPSILPREHVARNGRKNAKGSLVKQSSAHKKSTGKCGTWTRIARAPARQGPYPERKATRGCLGLFRLSFIPQNFIGVTSIRT